LTDQSVTLDQMGSRCKFYVFMVWNKSLKHDVRVYDLEENLLYEEGDVDISISEDGVDLASFVAAAKEMVKAPVKTTQVKQESYFPPGYGSLYECPGDDEPFYSGAGPRVKVAKGGKRKHGSG
jgi:hypothetical protein